MTALDSKPSKEIEKFFYSLEGKTDEEKRKAIEEYVKSNAEKAQANKRDLYSLICYHYGYTLDEVRAMNYPDIVVLRDGLHHRLCEHHGVPYEPKDKDGDGDKGEKGVRISDEEKAKNPNDRKTFDANDLNDIRAFWGV